MRWLLFFVWLTASGCASHGFNYLQPQSPRCAESFRPLDDTVSKPGTFKFVSFNIKFGKEPDKAMRTLGKNDLDDADVLVLQEMDLPSTRRIARELRVNYVYYPIAVHPMSGRQFGLAILSPWPIREDRKILLPRLESSDDISKMAVAATVWVKGTPVGVINAHLQSGLSPEQIGGQLRTVLRCAFSENCPQPGAPMLSERPYYVLAGDLNTLGSDHLETAQEVLGSYELSRVPGIGRTMKYLFGGGRLDHIFTSPDLELLGSGHGSGFFNTGSDHRPIWAELRFAGAPSPPWNGFDRSTPWETYGGGEECSPKEVTHGW